MEGILYNEYLLHIFGGLFLVWGITNFFTMLLEEKISIINYEIEDKVANKLEAQDIIGIIIFLATIIGMFILILRSQSKLIMWIMLIIGFCYLGLIVLSSFYEFIKYIFVKPSSNFEITTKTQQSLCFVSLFIIGGCEIISKESFREMINKTISGKSILLLDAIKMIVLIYWYFATIFFALTLLILILHNIAVLFGSKDKENKNLKLPYREFKTVFLSKKIERRIKNEAFLKRLVFSIFWVISLIIDSVKSFFVSAVNLVYSMIVIVVFYPKNVYIKVLDYLINLLRLNPGKAVILCSRFSLISSLIIVFVIDKYLKVFSCSGSQVYDFLCSVIIIPFLITQIMELKDAEKES